MSGEANQVLWRGIRPVEGIRGVWPARNSDRIAEEATQTGEGNSIVYTVPASKIFFMTSSALSCYNSAGGGNNTGVGIRNGDDEHQYYMVFHFFSAQSQHSGSRIFFPALEVPAGYDVYVVSSSGNIVAMASAAGWLEDA